MYLNFHTGQKTYLKPQHLAFLQCDCVQGDFFISLSVEFALKTSSLASMLLLSAYLVSVMFH